MLEDYVFDNSKMIEEGCYEDLENGVYVRFKCHSSSASLSVEMNRGLDAFDAFHRYFEVNVHFLNFEDPDDVDDVIRIDWSGGGERGHREIKINRRRSIWSEFERHCRDAEMRRLVREFNEYRCIR
jgi:hypothetical protein